MTQAITQPVRSRPNLDFVADIIDEISLEGIDGITILLLFERLRLRPRFIFPIDDDSKRVLWDVLVKISHIRFYVLPVERDEISAEELQCVTEAEKISIAVREEKMYPISISPSFQHWGSCFYLNDRKEVTEEVRKSSLHEILTKWGSRLVIVADFEHRMAALCTRETSANPDELFVSRVDFAYLEKIGRSRSRGINNAGPGSLLALGKEPRRIFYHVSSLLKHNLIVKFTGGGPKGNFVVLKKFTKTNRYETIEQCFMNQLIAELKTRPNNMMPFSELNVMFPDVKQKERKKYFRNECNQKNVDSRAMVPYRKLFPEASSSECASKKGGERTVRCVVLKDQIKEEKEDDIDDDIVVDGDQKKDPCIEVPIMTRVYKLILVAGTQGLSIVDVLNKLAITRNCARMALKKLEKEKLITPQYVQSGRQRVQKFTISAAEFNKSVVQELHKILMEEEAKKTGEHSSKGNETLALTEHRFEIHADTERKALRMGIILKTLQANGKMTKYDIQQTIVAEEERRGFKDRMDRRTLYRILEQMVADGSLQQLNSTVNGIVLQYFATADSKSVDPSHNEAAEPYAEHGKILRGIITASDKAYTEFFNEAPSNKIAKTPATEANKLYAPKFLRLSVLHDLVYYLVRGYTGRTDKTHEELLAELKSNCTLESEVEKELPRLYNSHISCYAFIPPLSTSHSHVPGWCTLGDIILNSPLSLYMKIVNLSTVDPKQNEYAYHPVRSHFPIRELPFDVRRGLLSNKILAHVVQDLRRLCFMGLLRFGPRSNRRKSFLELIYVNVNASIKDTTISPQRYLQIDNTIDYDVIKFTFHSKSDVKAYWVQLFNICLETKLGTRGVGDEEVVMAREFQKDILMAAVKPIVMEEAVSLDDGSIPGDGLGAGGIDSALYSFLRTNWVGAHKRVKLMKKAAVTVKPKVKKREREFKRQFTKKKSKKVGKIIYDELDMEAIRMMRTQRVQWSQNEDNILILSKAAVSFLCPNQRVCARISWTEMRTVLRKYAPESIDKTQRAIARRVVYLLRAEDKAGLVESLNKVLRNNPDMDVFDSTDLVSQIKPTTPNVKELQDKLAARFRDLVDYMVEKFLEKGLIHSFQETEIPDTMEEMRARYILDKAPPKTISLREINEDSIRAVLMSSLGSAADKGSFATQLFEIYRQYDEELLQSAIRRLHIQKIITFKKKKAPGQPFPVKPMPLRVSPYVFSRGFCYFMSTKYLQSVYHDSYVELNRVLCTQTGNTLELNLSNCGPAVFVLASLGYVKLTTAIPEQFIVLDHEYVPEETYQKIMTRYSQSVNMPTHNPDSPACPSSEVNATTLKRSADGPAEDEPAAKRPLVDDQSDVSPSKEDEETVKRSLKRQRSEEHDTNVGFRSARLALYTLREIANKEMECFSLNKGVDLFVVSTSKVLCQPNESLARDYGVCNNKNYKKILAKVASRADVLRVVQEDAPILEKLKPTIRPDLFDSLTRLASFISSRGAVGSSLQEILNEFPETVLRICLKLLEDNNLVLRLGLEDTRFVAQKHASAWSVQSFKLTRLSREKFKPGELSMVGADAVRSFNDGHGSASLQEHSTIIKPIMRPWIRIEGSVNRKVIDRFLGTMLGQIMICPAISLGQLTAKFASALTPSWTKELVDILSEIGCIVKLAVSSKKPTLFSEGSFAFTGDITGLEHDEDILLEPQVDAIIKLGHFIGNKSYSKDFLETSQPSMKKKPVLKTANS